MTKQELLSIMLADPNIEDIDDNGDMIGFQLVDVNSGYFHTYHGFEVIWNECEGCETEGLVYLK